MKITIFLILAILSLEVIGQGRPGGQSAHPEPGPDMEVLTKMETSGTMTLGLRIIASFTSASEKCSGQKIEFKNIKEIYEHLLVQQVSDAKSHDHLKECADSTTGDHVSKTRNCYVTGKLKKDLKNFGKDPLAADFIRILSNKKQNYDEKKVTSEDAKIMLKYLVEGKI